MHLIHSVFSDLSQTEQDHIPPCDLQCAACAGGPVCQGQGEEGPDRVHEGQG